MDAEKDAAQDERVRVPIRAPDDATSVTLEFRLFDAGNDWYWAMNWYRPDLTEVGPNSIPMINASASHEGVYVDITVDPRARELRLVRRGLDGEKLPDSNDKICEKPAYAPYCKQERVVSFPTR